MRSYIIAEMAWGYTGSYETALEILDFVSNSRANAVGIHITDMDTYMTKDYKCKAGQTLSARDEDNTNISVYDYLNKINMSQSDWLQFDKKATELGVDIVAMCNDLESFHFSKKLNIKRYVIAASLFYEYKLLHSIVKHNNNVIIRIGGASLTEIDDIISYIFSVDKKSKINLLAGIQLYPTPIEQLHINSIKLLIERYKGQKVTLGLADHIDGDHPYAIYLPALALAYGIETIEKHITTDRSIKLEDFEAALSGNQFKEFVEFIRTVEIALGNESLDYLVNPQNEKYRLVLRKRVVAGRNIKSGIIITEDMLVFMRCDTGVELEYLDQIIGKISKRNIEQHEGISFNDVE